MTRHAQSHLPRHRIGPPEQMADQMGALLTCGPVLQVEVTSAGGPSAGVGQSESAVAAPQTGDNLAGGVQTPAPQADAAPVVESTPPVADGVVADDAVAGADATIAAPPIDSLLQGAVQPAPPFATVNLPTPPIYTLPELGIYAPILRPPPKTTAKKAVQVQRDTGSTPSQHHANIQTALFRVADAARTAQRDMVRGVEGLALNSRWSIEAMANQIDGIVSRCTATIAGSARLAQAEISRSAEANIRNIVAHVDDGSTTLAARENEVRAELVSRLATSGSQPIRAAHGALIAAYAKYSTQAGAVLPSLATGVQPAPLSAGEKPAAAPETAATAGPKTFAEAGDKIIEQLAVAPADTGGGATGPYRTVYIDRAKAQATPYLSRQFHDGWIAAARDRGGKYASADNQNRFVQTALGLVAPTAKAMDMDAEDYQRTLSDQVYRQYGAMTDAQETAVSNIITTLRGPFGAVNAFDPANPNSLPFRAIKGLRDNGDKMKAAMRHQAVMLQGQLRAGLSDMARAYPDVILRLTGLLDGDDLLDSHSLLPRLEAAGVSVGRLHDGHLSTVREQADRALHQTRHSFGEQVSGLWQAVADTQDNLTESKLKAIFEFAFIEASFTGHFTRDLEGALQSVTGYADRVARELLAPVDHAKTAGTRVERAAVQHFNGQLSQEWSGYLRSVGDLATAVGMGESANSASQTKPFPQIEVAKNGELRTNAETLAVALKEPNVAAMAGGVALSILAAPFSGGVSLAAGAYVAYEAYSALPDKDGVASALAMPWPGALALEDEFRTNRAGEMGAQERIRTYIPDSDADKPRLLGLFSTNESTAATAKADLIEGANRLWGVNDEAVERLAQSFSPTELNLLTPEQITAMEASVRDNLHGVQADATLAYLDGNPARAAAVRIRADLALARQRGDAGLANFGQTMDQRIMAELTRGSGNYVPPEQLRQMTDAMYLELATLVPAPGQDGRSVPQPVDSPQDPQAIQQGAARRRHLQSRGRVTPNASHDDDQAEARSFQDMANQAANAAPDADRVAQARQRVLNHATRDYAQMLQQPHGHGQMPMGVGDDIYGSQIANQAQGNPTNAQSHVRDGVLYTRVNADTRAALAGYMLHGSSSTQARVANAVLAIREGERRFGGTSEADVIRLSQTLGSPAVSLAQARLAAARRNNDLVAAADARAELVVAQKAHQDFLVQVATQLQGPDAGAVDPAAAERIVAGRVNALGQRFDAGLTHLGTDLTERGSINLAQGMQVATGGAGTYDDLLTEVTSNRRRNEFDSYFATDGAKSGITREQLGVGVKTGFLSDFLTETSGDQAQALEINLLGVPETDADQAEIARVKARHQLVDGTGFISAFTMEGSTQQQHLQHSNAALGERLVDSIRHNDDPRHPVPDWVRNLPADQMFTPDGLIRPDIRQYVTNRHGQLYGSGSTMAQLSSTVEINARAYSDEIGRQESFFTGLVTAAAVAMSILLLFIPGVNVAAAGVLVALLAGSTTIALKAGLRGGRYGWEEAATDVAKTGIEAATAGVGGALGGAVKPGAGVLGNIARLGARINAGFGRVGGAVVREGMTAAISGVANQALDDRIWSKGIGGGLETLLTAGARGAITGGFSGGLSEGVSVGSMKLLTPGLDKGAAQGLARLGQRLGPAGRDILQESLSGLGGAVSSEGLSFLMDASQGGDPISLQHFLKRVGPAALRDMLSSAGKAGVRNHMKARYHAELSRVQASDADISDAQAQHLHRMAISAGEAQYGRGQDADGRPLTAESWQTYRDGVQDSRRILASLPPDLAVQCQGFSADKLQQIAQMRQSRQLGDPAARRAFADQIDNDHADADPRALFAALGKTIAADKAAAHEAGMVQAKAEGVVRRAQRALFADLPADQRKMMQDQPSDAITALPKGLQAEMRRLLRDGDPDGKGVAAILAKAGAGAADDGPDGTPHLEKLKQQIEGLLSARPLVADRAAATSAKLRADVAALLPEDMQGSLARMADKDVAFLHRSLTAKDSPSAETVGHLSRLLARALPDQDQAMVSAQVTQAIAKARTQQRAAADAGARQTMARRMTQMENVPPPLRALLAHLAEDALLEVRLAQATRRGIDPARLDAMLAQAKAAHPDLDTDALRAAILQTLHHSPTARPFFERFRQRRALISFVPREMRGRVRGTPILSLPDAVFAAYVKALPGIGRAEMAVTIRLNGEIVVLVRDGAPALALREEGRHVLQLHDPYWAAQLGGHTEDVMANWHLLPLGKQIDLARSTTMAEIAAHQDMLEHLDLQIASAWLPGTRRQAEREKAQVFARMEALYNRAAELQGLTASMRLAIEAGHAPRPDWLAQPARLFNVDGGPLHAEAPPSLLSDLRDMFLLLAQKASSSTLAQKNAAQAREAVLAAVPGLGQLQSDFTRVLDALLPRTLTPGAEKSHAISATAALRAMMVQPKTAGGMALDPSFLTIISKAAQHQDGFGPNHMPAVKALLQRMGDDLNGAAVSGAKLAKMKAIVQSYGDMIAALSRIQDPVLLMHSGTRLIDFVASIRRRKGENGADDLPDDNTIRAALRAFMADVGVRPYPAQSAAERVLNLGLKHLTFARATVAPKTKPIGFADLTDATLNFKSLGAALVGDGTGSAAGKKPAPLDRNAFILLLTGVAATGTMETASAAIKQAAALYTVYEFMLRNLDWDAPPLGTAQGRTPEDMVVALFYAQKLLHELPQSRALTPDMLTRFFEGQGFANTRDKAALQGLSHDDIRNLKITPDILDLLPDLHHLLAQPDLSEDALRMMRVITGPGDPRALQKIGVRQGDGAVIEKPLSGGELGPDRAAEIYRALKEVAGKVPGADGVMNFAETSATAMYESATRNKTPADVAADLNKTKAGAIVIDMTQNPVLIAKQLQAAFEHQGVAKSEYRAAMVKILTMVRKHRGGKLVVESSGQDLFVRVTERRNKSFLTGFVGPYVKIKRKPANENKAEEAQLAIAGGKAYIDIIDTVTALRKENPSINLFDALGNLFGGQAIAVKGDSALQQELMNDLCLTAILMFGIEPLRHPTAMAAAILSVYLGQKLQAVHGGPLAEEVFFGHKAFHEDIVGAARDMVRDDGRTTHLFDDALLNDRFGQAMKGIGQQALSHSGGLFPSSMIGFLEFDMKIDAYLGVGKVSSPGDLRMIEVIVARYGKLLDMAMAEVLPDVLAANAQSGGTKTELLAALLSAAIERMLAQIRRQKGTPL